jgi:hypothetical protein
MSGIQTLTWTQEFPVQEGFYWYKKTVQSNPWIVPMVKLPNGVIRRDNNNGVLAQMDAGYYAGPIALPMHPPNFFSMNK